MPKNLGSLVSNDNGASTTITTSSHILMAGRNRKIIAFATLWYEDELNPATITGVLYDSADTDIAMSLVVGVNALETSYGMVYVSIWQLDEADLPAPGTYDVQATHSAASGVRGLSLSVITIGGIVEGVSEDTDTDSVGGGGGSSVSTSLTPTPGAILVSVAACYATEPFTPGTDQTEYVDTDQGTYRYTATWEIIKTASEGQAFTVSGTPIIAMASASFRAAPAGSGVSMTPVIMV